MTLAELDVKTAIVVLGSVTALVAAISSIIKPLAPIWLEKIKLKKDTKKKGDQFKESLSNNKEIKEHLTKILECEEIDRVLIWSLQNGDKIFRNEHKWNLEFYDEVVIKSVLPAKYQLVNQKLNATYFTDEIHMLETDKVAFLSNSEGLTNRVARELTTGTGAKSMYFSLVKDINDVPLAFLLATSVHTYIDKPNEDDIAIINDICSRLSNLLSAKTKK